MKHEKIIKRSDGSRVKIIASIYLDSIYDKIIWNCSAFYCPANKRLFSLISSDQAATLEEKEQAKIELWEKLKP